MIAEIRMKDVASYKDEVIINTNTQVNLFYGLNGSGKTTISRFLRNLLYKDFASCSLFLHDPADIPDIYVYNQDYIDENFYEKDNQQGIFTVGQDAVEAEKELENIALKLERVKKIRTKLGDHGKELKEKLEVQLKELQKKLYQNYKHKYEGTDLRYCLEGKIKTHDRFYTAIQGVQYLNTLEYSFDDLLEEEADLKKNEGATLELLPLLSAYNLEDIKNNLVWEKSFINKGSSYLNALIDQLENINWVHQGHKYYLKEDQKQCPFCQENLPKDFVTNLEKAFDQTYDEAQNVILSLEIQYREKTKLVEEDLDKILGKKEFVEYVDQIKFNEIRIQLISTINANKESIQQKKVDLSKSIDLHSINLIIQELNNILANANTKITDLNGKISALKASRRTIVQKFWQLIRNEVDSELNTFLAIEAEQKKKINLCGLQYQRLNRIGKTLQVQKTIALSKTTNIEESKDRINSQLKALGIEGFSIETALDIEGHWYRLIREGESHLDTFKTLSEGEKTIITFIYFLESVFGMGSQEQNLDLLNRIVVIDDPISSLSNNHIYDVVRLIKRRFFKRSENTGKIGDQLFVKQLFVFTHSLYFLHELLKQGVSSKKNRQLHRISKQQITKISAMSDQEILNPYQEYWLIFKEAIHSQNFQTILPNVMRNILEEFFSFIQKRCQLNDILESLSDDNSDFVPLYRYINRESHSDLINLSEFSKIPNATYYNMFRKVFEEAGYLDHYKTMMNEEE